MEKLVIGCIQKIEIFIKKNLYVKGFKYYGKFLGKESFQVRII